MAVTWTPSGGFQSVKSTAAVPPVFRRSGRSSGGGGQSTVSQAELKKRAEAAKAKAYAEQMKRELAEKEAAKEKARLEKLKNDLIRAGARKSVIVTRDKKTGEIKNKQIIIQGLNQRVTTYENLQTGKTWTRTYKGGRLSSSLSSQGQSNSEVIGIKNELRAVGLKPLTNSKGQVIAFRSGTGKVYQYTSSGLAAYERDTRGTKTTPKELTTFQAVTKGALLSLQNAERQSDNMIAVLKKKVDDLEKKGERGRASLEAAKGITMLVDSMLIQGSKAVWESVAGIPVLSSTVVAVAKDPKLLAPVAASLATGIWDYNTQLYQMAKVSPQKAIGRIGGDYFLFKNVGKGLKVTAKVTARGALRLNPFFKSFKKGVINIRVPDAVFIRRGREMFLAKRIKNTKFRRVVNLAQQTTKDVARRVGVPEELVKQMKVRKPGQFKKFQKGRGVQLRTGTIGKGTPLSAQAKLAGTKGTITTAQADNLLRFVNRLKQRKNFGLVRKPIPGEATFNKLTKSLLKKFDDGTITKLEFKRLNKMIFDQTGGKTLLERSLYADPKGVVRFTRLGKDVAQEASLRDILSGNFRFLKDKPVVYVFPEGGIAKWPKSLQGIYKKLKAGKTLTFAEDTVMKKWQTKFADPRWKPVGDIRYKGGVELEVTLAPGNFIRKVKRLAVTEINGVKVPILQGRVVRLKPKTVKLLNKAKKGTIKIDEAKILRKAIISETKSPISVRELMNLSKNIRRRGGSGKPYLPVGRGVAARTVVRGGRAIARTRKSTRKPTTRKRVSKPKRKGTGRKVVKRKTVKRGKEKRPTTRKPTARKGTGRKVVGRSARKTTSRPGRTASKTPKKPKPPVRPQKGYRRKSLSKPIQTYYVVEKVRGKYKKLYPKPLKANHARDLAAYKIDNRLSKTALFVPFEKTRKVIVPPKAIKGYYSKVSRKLRPYRIRYGQKKMMVNGYIEKRKYFQDTVGEKAQAAKLRAKKRVVRKPVGKRRVVKRNTKKRVVRRRKK